MEKIDNSYQHKAEKAIENIEQSTTRVYKVKPEEVQFISILMKKVDELGLDLYIPLVRMSDGAIQCWFKNIHEESEYPTMGAYLGRIRLQGKKTYMQIIDTHKKKNPVDGDPVFYYELNIQEYIQLLDEWIRYITLVEKQSRKMWRG